MRIRSIVPKFWRSDDIEALDWHTRLVFIGLWSYVDDNGVGLDKLSSIVADLFAADSSGEPTETLRRVSLALDCLVQRGMITRYRDAGKGYVFINAWDSYQKPKNPALPRFPRPTSVNVGSTETVRTSSVEPPPVAPIGEGEKGRRGEGDEETCSTESNETAAFDYPPLFEEFWSEYPRKAGKRKALTAWLRARKRACPDELRDGARRYRADPNRVDEFTKHPEGWLNGDGWLDDPLPPRNGNGHRSPSSQPSKADIWTDAVINPARAAAASRKELT